MAKKLKVFEITTCWQHPRGRYLVSATSAKEAAEILGCSVYHVRTHSYLLDPESHAQESNYQLAINSPKMVFHKNHYRDEFTPLVKKAPVELSPELAALSEQFKK